MSKRISVFDTTLRDGAQAAGINFSIKDKVRILRILDELGFGYAEAGSPGISANDAQLFDYLKTDIEQFKNLNIVAFGPTCKTPDKAFVALVENSIKYISLVGKSDSNQVAGILNITKKQNLQIIADSISYAKNAGKEVFFNAENFFEGFKTDREYALLTLQTAVDAGASKLVLCDTNGGALLCELSDAVRAVKAMFNADIAIHCHNDMDLAVANTIAAVQCGAVMIQGTLCGIGERCGNANLCTIIPTLQLKLDYNLLDADKLKQLNHSARLFCDIANIPFNEYSPYIGRYSFAHKAGMHIDGELKTSNSFTHITPSSVGNESSFLISNQSGKSAIIQHLRAMGLDPIDLRDKIQPILDRIKKQETQGYLYENAEASLNLLIYETLGSRRKIFELEDFKIILADPSKPASLTSAMLKLKVNDDVVIVAEEGLGPVNAMDKALRKALISFYPQIQSIKLSDYKVRVIDSTAATQAHVMVNIESHNEEKSWRTVGVSTDIIRASWIALCDSIEYIL